MLKSILRGLYRHKSSLASENIITTIKSVNSYRITLSDPKTRYVNVLIKIKIIYHDISIYLYVWRHHWLTSLLIIYSRINIFYNISFNI